MFYEEPIGWRELQQEAQEERDPSRLIEIINQLNDLLTDHENLLKERQNVESFSFAEKLGDNG